MPSANISPDIHSGKASYKIHTECLGCAHLCTKLLASFRKLKKKKRFSPAFSELAVIRKGTPGQRVAPHSTLHACTEGWTVYY